MRVSTEPHISVETSVEPYRRVLDVHIEDARYDHVVEPEHLSMAQLLIRHNRETRRCYVPAVWSDGEELTQDHLHLYWHQCAGTEPGPRGDDEYELLELLIPDDEEEEQGHE